MTPSTDLASGSDGLTRCPWGDQPPDYADYHDHEWGRPTVDERTLFEKICLEGFQAGLSWLTILRKRDAFREAFCDFEASAIARFSADDVDRLVGNAAIIRHRGKIEATINNARRLEELWDAGGTLAGLIWSFEPRSTSTAPEQLCDVPAVTDESTAMSKELKRRGFRFVGPTTAYAAMQAMGVVNDHLVDCHVRDTCEALRTATVRPQTL